MDNKMDKPFKAVLLQSILSIFLFIVSTTGTFVGVNYGTDGDNLPRPQQAVDFMKKQGIGQVRIFDTDPEVLGALAGTNIQVIVGIPNEAILSVGASNATAANWVKKNIVQYLPNTNITGIAVGSQVLTDYTAAASVLVQTMKFIQAALVAANLDSQIKVSTPHSTDLILDAFPPSRGFFNQTYSKTVMLPMLDFLVDTGSYFMLNIYPQAIYQQNQQVMSIDYALFRPNTGVLDSITNLLYTSVFDAVLDATFSAMAGLNHTNVPIVVTETGWPSRGDMNEAGISTDNAATYNNNLVKHVLNNTGTPRRPGIAINTYVYEIFNEDRRQGPTSEKNYGIYYPDQTPIYTLDTTGTGLLGVNISTVRTWCIAKQGISSNSLQAALDYACGQGGADCALIQPGKSCYFPDSIGAHASYAFNNYYQKNMKATGSCDFAGVATLTTIDPSTGQCQYLSNVPINANLTVSDPPKNGGCNLFPSISSLAIAFLLLAVVM